MKSRICACILIASQFIGVSAFGATPGHLDLVKLTDRIYVAEDYYYYRENSAVYIGDKGDYCGSLEFDSWP
jgi:hypothetical protein